LLAVLLLGASLLPAAETCDSMMAKVRARYQNISDLKAHLVQILCSSASGTCTKYDGELELKRPNRMRMDITRPDKQQVICDGKTIWMYSVGDKQVMKTDLKSSPQFLVWLNPLDGLLMAKVLEGCQSNGEYQIFLELPELKDIIKAVKIMVDRKTLLIVGIEAVDVNGNSAEYFFSKIKANPGLKDSRFNFVMPKNVEIIENQ
jgi:outer membrane lipoprotein carrier protein